MSILAVIGIILIGFVIYLAVRDRLFEGYEPNPHPGSAPLEIRQDPIAPPRTIAPSGPNSPAQEPPSGEAVVYGDPAPRDPYADKVEASNAPENLRYPERAYRPAVENTDTTLAMQSGVGGGAGQNSSQSYQKFTAEPIQNSGEFMNGVYANDTLSDTNYSAF